MSLLPKLQQIHDPMPMSLGKAIARAIARAIAPKLCEEREFETGDYRYLSGLPAHPKLQAAYIDEANSRQIKGAAQASTTAEKVGTTRPLPVAAPPSQKFKVGDRVRLSHDALLIADHRGRSGVVYECQGRQLYGGCHFVALDGEGEVGRMFSGRYLELIPSPDAEDGGWYAQSTDVCPVGAEVMVMVRLANGWEFGPEPAGSIVGAWGKHETARVTHYKVVTP